jgi:tetratricopeptide (TPR) repeat protein
MQILNRTRAAARSIPRAALALLVFTPMLAACDLDTLLEAEDPFTVTPGTARDTANLETLYAGARSWFAQGYGGVQNDEGGIILQSGLMSDELYAADNFNTRRAVDRRVIDYDLSNASSDAAFLHLQRARAEALNAIDVYEDSPRAGNERHAELYSIAAFSIVMLAENYCAGIPLSRISESGTTFGEPMSAIELYELAISYFDEALGMPDAGAVQHNLARVGKGRALLNLGRFAEAAQAVAAVPTSFVFNIDYAGGSFVTPNPIYNFNFEEKRISVSLREGSLNRGLPYGTVAPTDPRVEISPDSLVSNSGEVPLWRQLKYTSQDSPVPLATGIEARLIEAEALLSGGNSTAYVGTLNTLRASVGLTALTAPATPAARVDQFFAERAYWLWLTGHRLSDMRRLIRQYNRTQDTVFPTGVTGYGLSYGTDVTLPIPYEEVNNPNYTVCANRGA